MKNPIKKMLRTHKEYCMMVEPKVLTDRSCTCGRDQALELYEGIEGFLLRLGEWMDEHDKVSSNSDAHVELDNLIERLV